MEPSSLQTLNYSHFFIKEKTDFSTLDQRDLKVLFSQKFDELENAYEKSKALDPSQSKNYSILLAQAEDLQEDLINIENILKENKENFEEASITLCKKHVAEMQENLPIGERGLLQADIRILELFFNRRSEETYQSPFGTFYHPTISPSELSQWFIPYIKEGMYDSSDCHFKTNHLGNNIFFNSGITCIGLVKKQEQRDKLEGKKPKKNTYPPSSWKVVNYYRSFMDKSWTELVLGQSSSNEIDKSILKTETFQVQTQGEQSLICVNFPPISEGLNCYEKAQKKVIEKLKADLLPMLEKWNFEKFEIFTTEQLIKLGYDREAACSGDNIVFFHKKVNTQDVEKE